MRIPVLIEPVASNGYRASTGQPLVMTAEGTTPAEALEHLRQALHDRAAAGLERYAPARVLDAWEQLLSGVP